MVVLIGIVVSLLISFVGSLCVGSFNIRAGDNFTGDFNLKNQAQVISDSDFEIIGLQEVDLDTERHPVDEPKILSELTELKHVHFTSFRRFEGGHYGIAILSKYPFIEERVFRYKGKSEDECKEYKTGDFCQGAISVKVELNFDNGKSERLWFVNTHLGLGSGVMAEEASLLVEWIEVELMKDGLPIFISGDFNTIPDSETHKIMTEKYSDTWLTCKHGSVDSGFTFPSNDPTERIDYLYTYIPNCESIGCIMIDVIESEVSDHRPLRVQFDTIM